MAESNLVHLESRFRLTGEIAGRQRTFLLVHGENRIGSLPANDVVLRAPGVSRHHALVTVGPKGVRLADLGSKNGTFVNGARAAAAELAAGDGIAVGSIELRLTEIEDEEAAMAFVVASRPPSGAVEAPDAETEVARPHGEGSWLELLDAFLGALHDGGEAALSRALGGVVRGLPAAGALLCELRPPDQPVVRAAWGEEGAAGYERLLEAVVEITPEDGGGRGDAAAGRPFQIGFSDEPAPLAWCLAREHDALEVLVVVGRFEHMERSGPLLRSLLAAVLLAGGGRLTRPAAGLTDAAAPDLAFPEGHVVGSSPPALAMYRELETASQGSFPVLVLGETGVGKEHVARILHLSSPRREGPLVAINCAAIPADLLESELFGIRKGVATGVSERLGRFQLAEGGTLVLDEIGDMPLPLQAKLLRVLEEGEIAPVGGKPTPVDVRIVAATNADLLELAAAGHFRRDLYYRLAGYVVRVPPLRERGEDVPQLIEHFLRRIAGESGRHVRGITLRALRALTEHPWPGNVRELVHEVRRLVFACHDGEAVDLPLLSAHLASATREERVEGEGLDLGERTAALERRLIRAALERTGGNRSQAARLLGISRQGLAMKVERLGLNAED
ncbi:MAG TPA: sigma 54-interacting transcriptional regulator [Thermoanaerobaculia bacterium]|jgi:DNA-binding NtrC family response regulator